MFDINLSADWVEEPSSHPDQYVYYSAAKDTALTMSGMMIQANAEQLPKLAHEVIQARLVAEANEAEMRGIRKLLSEPLVGEQPWGGHCIAYCGSDSSGRQFSFSGVVTRSRMLQFYVDSPSQSGESLSEILADILASVQFEGSGKLLVVKFGISSGSQSQH